MNNTAKIAFEAIDLYVGMTLLRIGSGDLDQAIYYLEIIQGIVAHNIEQLKV